MTAPPKFGTLEATLPFAAGEMIAAPAAPLIYATSNNSIQVINTSTLAVQEQISLGTTAGGIALSPDGASLYVAEAATDQIAVISTQSFSVVRSITTESPVLELAAGSGNRLFVLAGQTNNYPQIEQIDATSGSPVGTFPNYFAYYGNFQISPDLKTLYYGQHGLSPTTLMSFDVSTQTAQLKNSVSTGYNGKDVTLSRSGQFIAQPNGAPYQVSILNASDLSTDVVLNTGAYPSDMTFSPEDRYAYTTTYPYSTVAQWSIATGAELASIVPPDSPGSLITDNSGQSLFVSIPGDNETIVYATGVSVPEPATVAVLCGLAIPILSGRWRAYSRQNIRSSISTG